MKNIEQKRKIESADLATLELKANLNPEQRAYLEVLKAKMKKILGNKTKQELAKAGDLAALKNYKAILEEILEFLRTKEPKLMEGEVAVNPDVIKRQLDRIETEINKLKNKSDLSPAENGSLKMLEMQRGLINTPRYKKTTIMPDEAISIKTDMIHSEKEVWDLLGMLEGINLDDIFLIKKAVDSNGRLLALDLGKVADPEVEYNYFLKGSFKDISDGPKTNILKIFNDLESFTQADFPEELTSFSEEENKWVLPSLTQD